MAPVSLLSKTAALLSCGQLLHLSSSLGSCVVVIASDPRVKGILTLRQFERFRHEFEEKDRLQCW